MLISKKLKLEVKLKKTANQLEIFIPDSLLTLTMLDIAMYYTPSLFYPN